VKIAIEIVGWLGAAGLLAAYALVSARRLNSESAAFQAMNVVAGAALALNAAANGALPSTALNVIWVAIGAFALVGHARRRGRA